MATVRQDVYLNISGKGFEESKVQANNEAKTDGPDTESDFKYADAVLIPDEFGFDSDKGLLEVSGTLYTSGSQDIELGYISLNLNPDLDTVIDLIQFYMKKLGKLKTVLEATK